MDELRADEVDVRVEPTGGDDLPLTGDHLRPGPDDHPRRHAGHEVGVAGLADADDAPLAEAEVGLHDAPVIDDHRVRDHHVEDAVGPGRARRLPHAIADHLAAAELRLLAGHGQIALDADEELGVGEPHAIAGRRTVEIRVLTTRQSQAHDRRSHAASLARACSLPAPSVSALSPKTRRAPAISTSGTRVSSPGSERNAVPAGTLRRRANARERSNRRARFTSKKWKCDPICIGRSPVFATVRDRKSTRLNSSHGYISYAVFCLKKKNSPEQSSTP